MDLSTYKALRKQCVELDEIRAARGAVPVAVALLDELRAEIATISALENRIVDLLKEVERLEREVRRLNKVISPRIYL